MEREELAMMEEHQEEAASLLVRRSGEAKISGVGVEMASEIPETNGHKNEVEVSSDGFKDEDSKSTEEFKEAEEAKRVSEVEQTSENLVFFDKIEGVDSTPNSGEKTVTDSELEELESSSPSSGVQDVSATAENETFKGDSEKDVSPGITESSKASSEIEQEGSDLEDVGESEYDVETVIQKQRTHDLYCPNCNSCITRRVILRRRKRSVHVSDQEAKRNKTEAPVDIEVGSRSLEPQVQETDEASHDHDHDHDQETGGDGEDHERADVFRCLSCFSFFLPNGQVFRFKIFGDRTGKEAVQGKQEQSTTKHWFTSAFSSNKADTVAERGSSIQKDLHKSLLSEKVSTGSREEVVITTTDRAGSEFGRSKSGHLFASALPHRNGDYGERKDAVFSPPQRGSGSVRSSDMEYGTLTKSEEGRKLLQETVTSGAGHIFSSEVSSKHVIVSQTKVDVSTIDSMKISSISTVKGKDAVITIAEKPTDSFQSLQGAALPTEATSLLQSVNQNQFAREETRGEFSIEVIKSIVYGGLAESITSLSVVSSAAGGGAATLNILSLGAANLIGGLFVIFHNLWELRNDRTEQILNQVSSQATNQRDRYKELLGQRKNFILHVVVAILSYIISGLVPPVVYGFSFRASDDRDMKLLVTAAASLVCIFVLAVGHAYVKAPPKPYFKSVATFVILGFGVSGVAYGAGELIRRMLEELGVFPGGEAPGFLVPEMRNKGSVWAA